MEGGTSGDAGGDDREGAGDDGSAFRALFQDSFDAILIADDDGRYVEANPAACELFGLPREELLGRSIADFADEGFDFERAWQSFSAGKNERGLFPLVRADGERRTVEYSATREILPGRHLSILRDVTEREENERRIRRQRDALDTLNRINLLVRETIDDVIEARTRDTMERTVCTTIADSDLYAFAFVGERDRRDGGITIRTSAGIEREWIDRVEAVVQTMGDESPAVAAVRSNEIQLLDATDIESLPETARELFDAVGARSLFVAPLSFGDVGYGLLAVGANRPDAFVQREVEGFSALANAIGFAINAVESKRSLSADATTVVEVDLAEPDSSLARFAAPDVGTVSVEAVLPLEDESSLVYAWTPGGDDDPARPRLEASPGVERVRVVDRTSDGVLVEVLASRRTPVHALRDLGARVHGAAVDHDGTWHLVAAIPPDRDVRDLVESLDAAYPAVSMHRTGVEDAASRATADGGPLDRLTDRQRTVLEAAYQSGYYDWPRRGSSAEDLSESLGVAPQTVLEHLRKAERVVVDDVFESR